jgi:hypothetical protein
MPQEGRPMEGEMRVLICNDDRELKRIDAAIAAIEAAPPRHRQGKLLLLSALESERAELLRYTCGKTRRSPRVAAAA